MNETSQTLFLLTKVFQELGISYRVVGSVASSVHGIVRATLDIDLVANIQSQHISSLEQQLQGIYYIDTEMIKEAIQQRSSFNLIHLETMIKIDVFMLGQRPYDIVSFERNKEEELDGLVLVFKTSEDVLLGKLEWFVKTDKSSDRQWNDILGLLKINALDLAYLNQWAIELGLKSLFEKALREANSP